jgi:hypothetical protein
MHVAGASRYHVGEEPVNSQEERLLQAVISTLSPTVTAPRKTWLWDHTWTFDQSRHIIKRVCDEQQSSNLSSECDNRCIGKQISGLDLRNPGSDLGCHVLYHGPCSFTGLPHIHVNIHST